MAHLQAVTVRLEGERLLGCESHLVLSDLLEADYCIYNGSRLPL
jgi:hypothetical protein